MVGAMTLGDGREWALRQCGVPSGMEHSSMALGRDVVLGFLGSSFSVASICSVKEDEREV